MPLRNQKGKAKANAARFDAPAQLNIGPPSQHVRLDDVADHLREQGFRPQIPVEWSTAQKSALAQRCSVGAIRDQASDAMRNQDFAVSLRKNMLQWAAQKSADDEKEDPHRTEKRRRPSIDEVIEEMEARLPPSFRFMSDTDLARAYYQRDTKLQDNAIRTRADIDSLLAANKIGKKEFVEDRSPRVNNNALVVNIDVYSKPVRTMWAKERYHYFSGDADAFARGHHGTIEADEADEDGPADINSKTNKLARKGPYAPLQLSQKIEISSALTLLDLREAIICCMDNFPTRFGDHNVAYAEANRNHLAMPHHPGRTRDTDSCFIIEGDIIGETLYHPDSYATNLLRHFESTSKPRWTSTLSASDLTMGKVGLDNLKIRSGEPYWFLHQGNCEHIWTITSVRAPRSGEDLTSPRTSFLADGSLIKPVVRWSRPNTNADSHSLGICEICADLKACMVILGGADALIPLDERSYHRGSHNESQTAMPGLDDSIMSVCDACYKRMAGATKPTVQETLARVDGSYQADVSEEPWSGAGGKKWTVVPVLE